MLIRPATADLKPLTIAPTVCPGDRRGVQYAPTNWRCRSGNPLPLTGSADLQCTGTRGLVRGSSEGGQPSGAKPPFQSCVIDDGYWVNQTSEPPGFPNISQSFPFCTMHPGPYLPTKLLVAAWVQVTPSVEYQASAG